MPSLSLREEWFRPTVYGETPSPEESSEWLSLTSFMARMARDGLTDGSPLAIWELRTTLEEENVSEAVAHCIAEY